MKTQIICFDQDGNQLAPLEDFPEPDSVPSGLAALSGYLQRLFSSATAFASLLVATLDGQRGFGLVRRDSQTQLLVAIEWRREPEREQCIRELFSRHQLTPIHDYLAHNGFVPDATRWLYYLLPESPDIVTAVCRELLTDCCNVHDDDTLLFTLQ